MSANQAIDVAVCADRNIEVGLHVTLVSLLNSLRAPVRIHFIESGYDDDALSRLRATLTDFKDSYEIITYQINIDQFRNYRGLHGNKFAFARILLAETLDIDRVLYLDSDLVINIDLSEMFYTDLEGEVLGVSGTGILKGALEWPFFSSLGMEPYATYFNSGVLLIDLKKWREQEFTQKCFEFADLHPSSLLTADQTLLNRIFYPNNFKVLDGKYNMALYPSSLPESETAEGLWHFIGSPKPWDMFGEWLHGNYPLFKFHLQRTAFANYRSLGDISIARLKRTIRLARSYSDAIRQKFNPRK